MPGQLRSIYPRWDADARSLSCNCALPGPWDAWPDATGWWLSSYSPTGSLGSDSAVRSYQFSSWSPYCHPHWKAPSEQFFFPGVGGRCAAWVLLVCFRFVLLFMLPKEACHGVVVVWSWRLKRPWVAAHPYCDQTQQDHRSAMAIKGKVHIRSLKWHPIASFNQERYVVRPFECKVIGKADGCARVKQVFSTPPLLIRKNGK